MLARAWRRGHGGEGVAACFAASMQGRWGGSLPRFGYHEASSSRKTLITRWLVSARTLIDARHCGPGRQAAQRQLPALDFGESLTQRLRAPTPPAVSSPHGPAGGAQCRHCRLPELLRAPKPHGGCPSERGPRGALADALRAHQLPHHVPDSLGRVSPCPPTPSVLAGDPLRRVLASMPPGPGQALAVVFDRQNHIAFRCLEPQTDFARGQDAVHRNRP